MGSFLERYVSGERVEVWAELGALGPRVRDDAYFQDAKAVASETMRRARQNVEILLRRLDEIGYAWNFDHTPAGKPQNVTPPRHTIENRGIPEIDRLRRSLSDAVALLEEVQSQLSTRSTHVSRAVPPWDNRYIFAPPAANAVAQLNAVEDTLGGPLPLSVRAWYEEVGAVCLLGSHPAIPADPDWCCPDPLMMLPVEMLDANEEDGAKLVELSPDARQKADADGGPGYAIAVPCLEADARLINESHDVTFVEYLRLAFQCGGFAGYANSGIALPEEIGAIARGLLAI